MGRPRLTDPSKESLILLAANELLAQGSEPLSMDSVARRSGVSKATVYACFQDRDALLLASIDYLLRGLHEHILHPETLFGSPAKVLPAFAALVLDALSSPQARAVFRAVIAEGAQLPKLRSKLDSQLLAPVLSELSAYLKDESKRGTLRVPDPQLAAAQFLGMLKEPITWPLLLGQRANGIHPRRVILTATRVFLSAYSPAAARLTLPPRSS